MRNIFAAALLGAAFATPASAQVPNVQQLLKGLTNGNQDQDQALRDAFERGYQRGRQDEARAQHPGRGSGNVNRSDRQGANNRNNGNPEDSRQDYQDQQGSDRPQGNQNDTYGR